MIHPLLIHPKSIVVIGASENTQTPGGKVLQNLLNHNFEGDIYAVNPKFDVVQGITCYRDVSELPNVDMAIMAIAAKYCLETVKILANSKNTKAFIIFSAGFSEQDEEGAIIENQIVEIIENVGGTLLGPNNIGMFNTHYAGVFTTPIPKLDTKGVDFISGSGATAVFIIEAAMGKGLTFNSVYSVGNSAQIGVEDVLKYLDETYIDGVSSKIKLLYMESIRKPKMLLQHARSLYQKGVKIAAIKAGSSEDGSRAASSHTGAIANADTAVDALFEKAGIIRCYGREELVDVAGVLNYPLPKGKNIAIITHAGGPAVMLTDVLSKNGMNVPKIENPKAKDLLGELFPGSSVNNPIDFLATGTATQLGTIIEYCDNYFDEIDAMAVIFGSPGLFDVSEVYNLLNEKMKTSKKPIYPILPSVVNVDKAIDEFIAKDRFAFFDEVNFGKALAKTIKINFPADTSPTINPNIQNQLEQIIENQEEYLPPEKMQQIFKLMDIPFVEEIVSNDFDKIKNSHFQFPVVAKVIGPVHKTDVGGVKLNINSIKELEENFNQLMKIPDATGVLIQPMLQGMEIFVGAKKEGDFGHTIVCGMGGIMIEVMKDVSIGLAPLNESEINKMVEKLKSFPIMKGIRGKKGININSYIDIIKKVSALVHYLPEIAELDINPLLATDEKIIAVDARIRIKH